MAKWTDEEFAEIQRLEEHAIDYRHYKVHCSFCDAETEELEFPSGAEAYTLGFRIVTVNKDEDYVACKECQEKEAWKEWEEEEEAE